MTRRSVTKETMADTFEEARSDYSAAKQNRYRRRRTGISASGSGADFHYRSESEFLRIIEMARDMDRNDAIVGQMIDRAVANTIQDGMKLNPQTGDESINQELSQRWQEWSCDAALVDSAREMCFADMESMVFRHTLIDGDMIALLTSDGTIQLVEGHRVRTPSHTKQRVVHGVLLDGMRRRIEYWIAPDNIEPNSNRVRPSEMTAAPTYDEFGNRQVLHIYNPKRVTQTRGVSALAPVFDSLGMFEDINFAKLVQQQVVSCFAVLEEREAGLSQPNSPVTGTQTTETVADGSTRLLEGVQPGMRYIGEPGVKLTGFSPNVPNAEYFEHVRLILTLIGLNVGLPLVLTLLDSTATNFSGWRGAIDQARLGFRRNQRFLIERFHRPVYLWKLGHWLLESESLANAFTALDGSGSSIFAHRWNPPTWPYIEPLKDANADAMRLEKGLISPRRLHAERGRDWIEIAAEIVDDRAVLIETAITRANLINRKHQAAQVDWRELAGMEKKNRGNAGRNKVMEDLAQAANSGVEITTNEVRGKLGLQAEPPEGTRINPMPPPAVKPPTSPEPQTVPTKEPVTDDDD